MYRCTDETAVLDRKYHKTVRKMAQNYNTANPIVPLLIELPPTQIVFEPLQKREVTKMTMWLYEMHLCKFKMADNI